MHDSDRNTAIASILAICALIYLRHYDFALLACAICGGQIINYLNSLHNDRNHQTQHQHQHQHQTHTHNQPHQQNVVSSPSPLDGDQGEYIRSLTLYN
jgi:hypothetical protein